MFFGCAACCADNSAEAFVVQAQPSALATPGLPVTETHDENSEVLQPFSEPSPDEDENRQDDLLCPPPPLLASDLASATVVAPAVTDSPTTDSVSAEVEVSKPVEDNLQFVEFEAVIDKSGGEKLCLDISAYDGKTLLVGRVKDGPVQRWNSEQGESSHLCIQRGDRITGINGRSGDSDALLSAAKVDVLKMTVLRLLEFTVKLNLQQGGDALNVDFDDSGDGRCIVRSVSEGLALRGNKRNTADIEMRPGDIVLQVNGVNTTKAESVRVLTSAFGDIDFRLRRPAKSVLQAK